MATQSMAHIRGNELPARRLKAFPSVSPKKILRFMRPSSDSRRQPTSDRRNGDSIYGTHPWKRAAGETAEGIPVRFTEKDSAVYATLLGQPKTTDITLKSLSLKVGSQIYLLGQATPLIWSQQGDAIKVSLPATLPGRYANVLKVIGPLS